MPINPSDPSSSLPRIRQLEERREEGLRESNPAQTDQLEIQSNRAEIQSYLAAVQEAPDVRQEFIQSLREQIQLGRYQPNPERVAERILELDQALGS